MCGIVGVFGDIEEKDNSCFADMLAFDTVRGWDSTGILRVSKYLSKAAVLKSLDTGFDVIRTRDFKDFMRGPSRVLIGHNRAATSGGVVTENAHPFRHGSITGVHNGTLRTTNNLPDNDKFVVDSDNLIYTIDKLGLQKAYPLFKGALAVAYWDRDSETVNLFRNAERPLFITKVTGRDVYFISSEPFICLAACARHGVKTGTPVLLEKHKHYSYTIEKNYKGLHVTDNGVWELTPFSYPLALQREEDSYLFYVNDVSPTKYGTRVTGVTADGGFDTVCLYFDSLHGEVPTFDKDLYTGVGTLCREAQGDVTVRLNASTVRKVEENEIIYNAYGLPVLKMGGLFKGKESSR